MQKLIIAVITTLFTTSAFAAGQFACTLPQAEEFRVGIDLTLKTAEFFDNDSTSTMNYLASRPSSSNTENEVLIFVGKDNGGSGDLQLEFNKGRKRIKLSTVETDGTIELLGFAKCSEL